MKSSFFQPPEFLALPIFGLSISQSAIKLVKMKRNNRGLIPVAFENISVNETCDFFSGTNDHTNCAELETTLKKIKKKHGIHFAQLSIPEENTYVFRVMVPQEAIGLVDDFILNNMDQHIPLGPSDVLFDYKILKSHIFEDVVPVVVTAIPKVIVEKYTKLVESCGIFVIGCEPETHAIARCVIDRGDKNPYIIIYVDQYATRISVVEEGLVQYTQTLLIKTQDIEGTISVETEKTLKETINRVIIYWFTSKEQKTQANKIENVILIGEGVDSHDFINFFENNLSVNAVHANVWKNCFDISTYVPEISKKDSLKYATCVGLSMFKLK